MNVLVLEDNKQSRLAIKKQIKLCEPSATVLLFEQSKEAYYCAAKKYIDVFLLDIVLKTGNKQDASGIEFASMIRAQDRYKLTPILFVTSLHGMEEKLFQEIHCYSYIEKPIGNGELLRKNLKEIFHALTCQKQSRKHIPIYHAGMGYWLYEDEIIFLKMNQRNLQIHTITDEITIPNYSIKKFQTSLTPSLFLEPIRGTIVNISYIEHIDFSNHEIYLKNADYIVPLSNRKCSEIKKQYLRVIN